ncbi:uncharacterized protein LACBIDRAFT_329728 [Laccaria bicolor S238N-H82]|uniref:Predicted protein n=1 Tax=Laccaria bicolor (strain S238N-H82 / ATCC MYA-4686) TaxID=486041 RepID=B0DJ16_LACBS|nr:uncharacterized protein LACBIDRAFT_329728 [Laccaria bicolor S238N-H82]EDR05442.1 predicted protein [Laccaria bicolor S238N-H82]|eukprot:XP_001884000.1 predicted protein [Laccaria bicolor S238N-H82]
MSDLFRDRQRTLFSREPSDSDATPMNSANLIQGATLVGAMLAYPSRLYSSLQPSGSSSTSILYGTIAYNAGLGLIHILFVFAIIGQYRLFLKRMWALSRKRYPTVLAVGSSSVFGVKVDDGDIQIVRPVYAWLGVYDRECSVTGVILNCNSTRRLHRRNDVHAPLPTNVRHANRDQEQTEFREDCEFVGGLDAFYWIGYVVWFQLLRLCLRYRVNNSTSVYPTPGHIHRAGYLSRPGEHICQCRSCTITSAIGANVVASGTFICLEETHLLARTNHVYCDRSGFHRALHLMKFLAADSTGKPRTAAVLRRFGRTTRKYLDMVRRDLAESNATRGSSLKASIQTRFIMCARSTVSTLRYSTLVGGFKAAQRVDPNRDDVKLSTNGSANLKLLLLKAAQGVDSNDIYHVRYTTLDAWVSCDAAGRGLVYGQPPEVRTTASILKYLTLGGFEAALGFDSDEIIMCVVQSVDPNDIKLCALLKASIQTISGYVRRLAEFQIVPTSETNIRSKVPSRMVQMWS